MNTASVVKSLVGALVAFGLFGAVRAANLESGHPLADKVRIERDIALMERRTSADERMFSGVTRELFNGKDLSGWYTYLRGRGKNNDPKGVVTVRDGVLRISGEEWGAVVTEEEFSDYRLDVEYRFTGTRFGEKAKKALDSGILFHSTGDDGAFCGTWLYSHEYNLITGASGDIWTVGDVKARPDMVVVGEAGGTLTDPTMPEGPYRTQAIWKEGGKRVELRGNRRLCRCDIAPNWTDTPAAPYASNERPTGEWNTATLVCRGETVECWFNGRLVNKAVRVVPSRGKIQLQSEGCGIEFRRVTLQGLGETPVPPTVAGHVLRMENAVLAPEEGYLLGNGDLSVSTYQDANSLIFRFGKGDVWDRRVFTNDCMRPATVAEFRNGVLNEGWQASGGNGNTTKAQATKGTKDGARMKELLGGSGRTPIRSAGMPCPKPVGELKLRLPIDLAGQMKTSYRLHVEEGRLEIVCAWPDGIRVTADAVVDPDDNVFSLAWKVDGWNDHTYLGREKRLPVWFQMWRWPDPKFVDWARKAFADCRHNGFYASAQKVPIDPLPPPRAFLAGREGCIEQTFYPEPTFPEGFRYVMTLASGSEKLGRCVVPGYSQEGGEAWIEYLPLGQLTADGAAGELALTVKTSRDASLVAAKPKTHAEYVARAKASAAAYWKTRVAFPQDAYLENLWYSIYHARRCVLKGGTVPPGLFLPSTVNDFSWWHGDYHANYNLESIYWGDFTANRLEQADAYLDCTDFFADIGRKIARDYYNGRGVYIQLEGYPIRFLDDPAGRIPLGRMAYMTGWFMTRYWEYWQFTRDRAWLAKRGYPFIRDCALFYLDFLRKAPSPDLPPQVKDGLYHAFPSICGESDMRDPMKLCDGWQVMIHCRHALYAAIETAKILGVDEDLRAQWQDRLDNLGGGYRRGPKTTDYEWHCACVMQPEHTRYISPYRPNTNVWDGVLKPRGQSNADTWYEGIQGIWKIGAPRTNGFQAERNYAAFRRALYQWTHPNGMVWAMALQNYGRAGLWSETLSVMAPFQEMMLQSWDGAINVFPRWPKDKDASFRNWRAQGAFLVSAEQRDGRVVRCEVRSEKGEDCLVHGTWKVEKVGGGGEPVPTDRDPFGRLRFKTQAGVTYCLTKFPSSRSLTTAARR